MSAVATREPPAAVRATVRHGEPSIPLFDDGVTLEDVMVHAWTELAGEGSATCPVCRGRLTVDGCEGCGSELR